MIPLGKLATVFQAEVIALNRCAKTILTNGIMGTTIAICSDSAAAIKALSKTEITSRIVWECYENMQRVGNNNDLSIIWVPGHSGVTGNEEVDKLAKKAANLPVEGPEPFCGISLSVSKAGKRYWLRNAFCNYWASAPKIKFTQRRYKLLIDLSKKKLRIDIIKFYSIIFLIPFYYRIFWIICSESFALMR